MGPAGIPPAIPNGQAESLESDEIFHPPGETAAHLEIAKEEEIASMSEEAIRELFLNGVTQVYPHFKRQDLTDFHLFRTRTAATVCDLHFSKRVPECRTEISGLHLANMAHVYPDERSVNNSIRVACETLRVMGHDSSMVPKGRSLSGLLGFGFESE